MKRSIPIPIYNLQERGKDAFEIHRVSGDYHDMMTARKAHRDDNYLLIYQESGLTKVMIDFEEIIVEGAAILCILPGQVHYGILSQGVQAWIMAINTDWILNDFRSVLMEAAVRNRPVTIEDSHAILFKETFQLLQAFDGHTRENLPDRTLRLMLDVCLSLFVSAYQKDLQLVPQVKLRPALITKQFRSLLLASYRTMKSPAHYAASLNISPAYLNEVVKETTGYPVSHWIHQEIILEAKRMLFYTNNTVKEIAFSLGYADTAYFIRLFGKVAGQAPLQFRQKCRR